MAYRKIDPEDKKRLIDRGFDIEAGQTISKLPEYMAWRNMIYRCKCPTCPKYRYYGGRNIMVCDEWHDSIQFLLDIGPRPTSDHELDRINNDEGYNPDNCDWVLKVENMRHCSSVKLDMDKAEEIRNLYGEGVGSSELAQIYGVHRGTIDSVVSNRTWIQ